MSNGPNISIRYVIDLTDPDGDTPGEPILMSRVFQVVAVPRQGEDVRLMFCSFGSMAGWFQVTDVKHLTGPLHRYSGDSPEDDSPSVITHPEPRLIVDIWMWPLSLDTDRNSLVKFLNGAGWSKVSPPGSKKRKID